MACLPRRICAPEFYGADCPTPEKRMSMKNPVRVADSNFDRLQARNGLTAKNASQMDRIVAALAAGGTPVASSEEKIARQEKRIAALNVLSKRLHNLNAHMADLYMSDKSERMRKLTAARKAVQNLLDAEDLPTGIGKYLRACANELTSLYEGTYVGASVDRKTLTLLSVAKAIEQVAHAKETSEARILAIKAETAESVGVGVTDETERVIKRNAQDSAKMPSLKNREYAVARVAVIPVLPKAPPSEVLLPALKRRGFNVDDMAGYVAIHNQLVLGINKSTLKRGVDVMKAAKAMKSTLEQSMGTKLAFVSEKPAGYAGGAWFWLATEREMTQLAKALPGGRVNLSSWGFAF